MAILSMGECRWRMLRRMVHPDGTPKGPVVFSALRSYRKTDQKDLKWLIAAGFVAVQRHPAPPESASTVGLRMSGGLWQITDTGVAAAHMGEYDSALVSRPAAGIITIPGNRPGPKERTRERTRRKEDAK